MSKISRGKAGEDKVIKILKKREEYFKLLNDITFKNENSEMTHQVDHIFINPHGVFVIETKNYFGEITVIQSENLWFKTVKGNKEKISNPLKQNRSHRQMVKKILNGKFDVISLVVFVKNNAPYLGDENVINLKDLNAFIDTYPYERILDEKEIDDICKIIKSSSIKIKKSEHLENISYLAQISKERKQEIEYAIESGKCPWCDKPIIQDGMNFRCSECNFKFKL